MAHIVYFLTVVTCLVCTFLLGRAYRRSSVPLLFWSAMCFATLTLSNVILILDLIFISSFSLAALRASVSLVATGLLLYGLIFKAN